MQHQLKTSKQTTDYVVYNQESYYIYSICRKHLLSLQLHHEYDLPHVEEEAFEGAQGLPGPFVLGRCLSFIIVLCPQSVIHEIHLKQQKDT